MNNDPSVYELLVKKFGWFWASVLLIIVVQMINSTPLDSDTKCDLISNIAGAPEGAPCDIPTPVYRSTIPPISTLSINATLSGDQVVLQDEFLLSLNSPINNLDSLDGLLPSPLFISDELKLRETKSYSNQDIADLFDNPHEILDMLNQWGRITSQTNLYSAVTGCEMTSGIATMLHQVVLYENEDGVQQGYDWSITRLESDEDTDKTEYISRLGEEAFAIWSTYQNKCDPPQARRSLHMGFYKYNVYASVSLSVVQGTMSDFQIKTLATNFLETVESNIELED